MADHRSYYTSTTPPRHRANAQRRGSSKPPEGPIIGSTQPLRPRSRNPSQQSAANVAAAEAGDDERSLPPIPGSLPGVSQTTLPTISKSKSPTGFEQESSSSSAYNTQHQPHHHGVGSGSSSRGRRPMPTRGVTVDSTGYLHQQYQQQNQRQQQHQTHQGDYGINPRNRTHSSPTASSRTPARSATMPAPATPSRPKEYEDDAPPPPPPMPEPHMTGDTTNREFFAPSMSMPGSNFHPRTMQTTPGFYIPPNVEDTETTVPSMPVPSHHPHDYSDNNNQHYNAAFPIPSGARSSSMMPEPRLHEGANDGDNGDDDEEGGYNPSMPVTGEPSRYDDEEEGGRPEDDEFSPHGTTTSKPWNAGSAWPTTGTSSPMPHPSKRDDGDGGEADEFYPYIVTGGSHTPSQPQPQSQSQNPPLGSGAHPTNASYYGGGSAAAHRPSRYPATSNFSAIGGAAGGGGTTSPDPAAGPGPGTTVDPSKIPTPNTHTHTQQQQPYGSAFAGRPFPSGHVPSKYSRPTSPPSSAAPTHPQQQQAQHGAQDVNANTNAYASLPPPKMQTQTSGPAGSGFGKPGAGGQWEGSSSYPQHPQHQQQQQSHIGDDSVHPHPIIPESKPSVPKPTNTTTSHNATNPSLSGAARPETRPTNSPGIQGSTHGGTLKPTSNIHGANLGASRPPQAQNQTQNQNQNQSLNARPPNVALSTNANANVASGSASGHRPSNTHDVGGLSSNKPPGAASTAPTSAPTNTKPTKPETTSTKPQPTKPTRPTLASHNTRYVDMLLALDDIPQLYKWLASFFTWILLAGFVLFPGTFNSFKTNGGAGGTEGQRLASQFLGVVSQIPIFVLAWVCCAVGVAGMAWLWWRWHANYIWVTNNLFIPGALNSLAGVISTLSNVYGVQGGSFSGTAKLTLVVTGVSAAVLGLFAGFYMWILVGGVKRKHDKTVGRVRAGKHGEGVVEGVGS